MSGGPLEWLGRAIAGAEAGRGEARSEALARAQVLRGLVADAVARFEEAAARAGAPHLAGLIRIGPVEPDDKSIRAFQIRIARGRHEGVIVSKDRGEVMLVGPYLRAKEDGPCRPIQIRDDPSGETLKEAVESFLTALIERSFAK